MGLWDESIQPLCTGDNYPCTEISYFVYIRKDGIEPMLTVPISESERFNGNEVTLSFTNEGNWAVGVATVRDIMSGPDEISVTLISQVTNWSDEPNGAFCSR